MGFIADWLEPSVLLFLHLPDIAELWRRGSVISSWLLDLTAASAEDRDRDPVRGELGCQRPAGAGHRVLRTDVGGPAEDGEEPGHGADDDQLPPRLHQLVEQLQLHDVEYRR